MIFKKHNALFSANSSILGNQVPQVEDKIKKVFCDREIELQLKGRTFNQI